jgi:hypothetical protein
MDRLPDELWHAILSHCDDAAYLAHVAPTCRALRRICDAHHNGGLGLESSLRALLIGPVRVHRTISYEVLYRSVYCRCTCRSLDGRSAVTSMVRRVLRQCAGALRSLRGVPFVSDRPHPHRSATAHVPDEWKTVAYRLRLVNDVLLYRNVTLRVDEPKFAELVKQMVEGVPDAAIPLYP